MSQSPTELPSDDPVAIELLLAVRGGDLATAGRLLSNHPEVVSARIGARGGTRTALHMVTDWPGYFPNGAEMVRLLLEAGADPDVRTTGPGRGETPLHWAASSDDHEVARALIDGGADIDAPDGSIGTPLANAVGYGCWQVARLLVERGAVVETLWEAAALGLQARTEELLGGTPAPTQDELDAAFWQACHGGQRRMAEFLLERGASIDASPDYAHGMSAAAVAGEVDTQRQAVVAWLTERAPPSS